MEGIGFEPTRPIGRDLAGPRFKPLSHPSENSNKKDKKENTLISEDIRAL
jgi:hypothetical protein|tara:strand:+ start:227 stop:376 length:150 start_codon:yes stop_codon:yes gene_type:complete